MHETSRNVAKKESLELRAGRCCTMPSRDTVHVPYDMNIIMDGPRKQVEMLKEHEIQKSHARENVSYDVIMRHSTRNTRLRISRFSRIRTPQWLSNYHSDSVCLTKVNFTTSLLFFFFPRWINSGWGRQSSKRNHCDSTKCFLTSLRWIPWEIRLWSHPRRNHSNQIKHFINRT